MVLQYCTVRLHARGNLYSYKVKTTGSCSIIHSQKDKHMLPFFTFSNCLYYQYFLFYTFWGGSCVYFALRHVDVANTLTKAITGRKQPCFLAFLGVLAIWSLLFTSWPIIVNLHACVPGTFTSLKVVTLFSRHIYFCCVDCNFYNISELVRI